MAGAEARTRSGACPRNPAKASEQNRSWQSCSGRPGCWRIRDGVSGCWAGDGRPGWAFACHCVESRVEVVVAAGRREEGEEMSRIGGVCCCLSGRWRWAAARGRRGRGQRRLPCGRSCLHGAKEGVVRRRIKSPGRRSRSRSQSLPRKTRAKDKYRARRGSRPHRVQLTDTLEPSLSHLPREHCAQQ